MAKLKKAKRKRKFCYVCKEWIEWWEHPDQEHPQDAFAMSGHYDKDRLLDEGKKIANEPQFKRYDFKPTDLADYFIKGVDKQTKRNLVRVKAIPSHSLH